jgi:3-dehydroquinate synthase
MPKTRSMALAPPDQPADGTMVYEQELAVRFVYPVHFTRDAFDPANTALAGAVSRLEPGRRHRLVPVVDAGVAAAWPGLFAMLHAYVAAHGDVLALVAPPLVVPGGEAIKNDPDAVAMLHRHLHDLHVDRQSCVLAIGGGAVLDAVGYAAAITHRGVRIVRVPTTVLAQCDGGVGVKNGVNAHGVKNFLGTFAPPFAIVNDERFLETLPARDRRAGMAEAVKVALVRDASFFEWLETEADALAASEPAALATLVRRCASLHLRHIATGGDPFEQGSARPLDHGHWAGHALETLSGHRLRHGEAVAIGIALDTFYAADAGVMDAAVAERICGLLERLGLALWDDVLEHGGPDGRPAVLRGLEDFREHLGGELTITLIAEVGRGVDVGSIEPDGVERAMARLRARAGRS